MRLQQTTTSDLYTTGSNLRGSWPDAVAYREAIQTPHISLSDPTLQTYGIQLDRRGLPVAYAGRFAIVFRLVGENGEAWALRCFTTPGDDAGRMRAARYDLVQKYVDEHRNIFVPFRYIPKGIRIGKHWYPTLAMRWATGEPMGRWVESHRHNPEALRRLCGALTDLLIRLEDAGVAHGDWQHDNLLVADEGRRITLVDYDGMYVPELAGQMSAEIGHPNYQHPSRTAEHFGVGLDRFACLVIQTALLALAQEPSLWDRYSDGESLLFKREDLIDPEHSVLFNQLRALAEYTDDEMLADAVARLQDACHAGAMSTLLPAIASTETTTNTPTYDPIQLRDIIRPDRAVTLQSAAEAVGGKLDLKQQAGQWWLMPEVVTRTVSAAPPVVASKHQFTGQRQQAVTTSPKDVYTFIERVESETTRKSEESHLLRWRLGTVGMVLAIGFILTAAVALQNFFLPIYFAWLLAYASLGLEKWPRRVIYEELVSEIAKMEKLIEGRNREILEKGGSTLPGGIGVSTASEYISTKLKLTSINRVLEVNGIKTSTLRLLRSAGIETALDLQRRPSVEKVPAHQMTALQNWVRELENAAANEYKKSSHANRSAPGEVNRKRHEVAEFERHVAILRRELELFPDVSWQTYIRKLFGQSETPTASPKSTP